VATTSQSEEHGRGSNPSRRIPAQSVFLLSPFVRAEDTKIRRALESAARLPRVLVRRTERGSDRDSLAPRAGEPPFVVLVRYWLSCRQMTTSATRGWAWRSSWRARRICMAMRMGRGAGMQGFVRPLATEKSMPWEAKYGSTMRFRCVSMAFLDLLSFSLVFR
jgi:hypothetical protein